jgi:hypothetical protein
MVLISIQMGLCEVKEIPGEVTILLQAMMRGDMSAADRLLTPTDAGRRPACAEYKKGDLETYSI